VPLTIEQVAEMAPDDSSRAAGQKLMAAKHWDQLGRSTATLWGLCRGSAVYQVKVELAGLGYHCSCPSRKFPCKHVLGLLFLSAASPAALPEAETPDWVSTWLERRQQQSQKKAERQEGAAGSAKPVDEAAQQKRAEQRDARVSDGLTRLDLWLRDLVRAGLASVEAKPASFWEEQSRRLVDAQAPALAARISRLAAIPRSSPDWPDRLLAELGRIKLLIHAWGRFAELSPDLQADVRQLLGWTITQDELQRTGERIEDTWSVIGQWVDDDSRIRAQRSWLMGRQTGRTALVLQFATGGQAFTEPLLAGTEQIGTLAFYPGAARQRAAFAARQGDMQPLTERLSGAATIDDFFAGIAESLSRQPWTTAFGTVLLDVTLIPAEEVWHVCDRDGQSLPLWGRDHWKLLALSGGHSFDLAGEWDGHRLRPLGLFVEGAYRLA
jgi:hypothetical protein